MDFYTDSDASSLSTGGISTNDRGVAHGVGDEANIIINRAI
jgi:hypothetical protein